MSCDCISRLIRRSGCAIVSVIMCLIPVACSSTADSTEIADKTEVSVSEADMNKDEKTNASDNTHAQKLPAESVEDNSGSGFSININGREFSARLYDNSSAKAFEDILPLSIEMQELNGNEKYYYLSDSLPSATEKVGNISKGDIMIYGDSCIVIFYESFSTPYSYTRLGYIENPDGLEEAVGSSNARVTISK